MTVAENRVIPPQGEQLTRTVLDAMPDAIAIVDGAGLIEQVNANAARLFGYRPDELVGRSVEILVPERYRHVHASMRSSYQEMPHHRPLDAGLTPTARRKDGSEFPVDISLTPVAGDGGGTKVVALIREAASHHIATAAEPDENIAADWQRTTYARLMAVQEQERSRIASEIHDETIQAMTATSLRMQQLRRHLTDPGQVELLTRLEDAVQKSIGQLRNLMFDLRPASLDGSGLAAALSEVLARSNEESPITFKVEDHLVREPDGDVRTALYRIAQEAIGNARTERKASSLRVELQTVVDGTQITIADDGRAPHGDAGLVSIRERAQMAGGWLTTECPPGGGNRVEFWLPNLFEAPA